MPLPGGAVVFSVALQSEASTNRDKILSGSATEEITSK
jgi:hypothetical protein